MNKYLILILSIMVMTCSKPQNSTILEKMINKLEMIFLILSHTQKHRLRYYTLKLTEIRIINQPLQRMVLESERKSIFIQQAQQNFLLQY